MIPEELAFDRHDLLPAIVQDYLSGEVLMLAYMNKESLALTHKTGLTCFWSRSRRQLWQKGKHREYPGGKGDIL